MQNSAACASSEPQSPALPWVRCANPAPSWASAQPPLVTALLNGEVCAVGKTCVVQEVAQLLTRCQWEQAVQILAGTWLCRVAVTTPQVCSPKTSWAGCYRTRLAPVCLQKEFPTRKGSLRICSDQTSKKCQRRQGNETHTEPAERTNKHRQKSQNL